ncbi:MAG: DEAD/DEAH box helicase family protein [Chloroflexota bacterium]
MTVRTNEANFESIIEQVLVHGHASKTDQPHLGEGPVTYQVYGATGGYLKRTASDYDTALCLDTKLLCRFVQSTQPETWAQFKKLHKDKDAEQELAKGVARKIAKRGTLYVLRKGYQVSGFTFRLAYFRPNSTLNPEMQQKYAGNLFSVIRQLTYREGSKLSLDLGLFLNGMPIFTAELKNPMTGQTVFDAIEQYKRDRDPKDALFAQGRCLAHFAVDPTLVYFTTTLAKQKTRFFPFNRGHNMGAGNPPEHERSRRFATAYLWEEVWTRDSVLNLVHKFIQFYDIKDEDGEKTGDKMLLFPRYHQLTAVRDLINHAYTYGIGQRYLIQHSAGSGKTYTIAWLAHQLIMLHNDEDERVFDSVIVISDRRILDRQLQQAMLDFEQKLDVVAAIGDKMTSRHLREALESGKQIIVCTLQKFPVISRQIGELQGTRFAVIVDEAHSSQSGASKAELNRALMPDDLQDDLQHNLQGDLPPDQDMDDEDMEDVLAREMALRRHQPNISTFAFTATPKAKTLQLFGTQHPDGSYKAFSLYPMRQAIEEQFIMDVLTNYTTYDAYYRLLKTVADDPHYDKNKATRLLRTFIAGHERTIAKKVAIIVEHYASQVRHRIGGKAKAMVVTRSREHAVRYKRAIDSYLNDQGYAFQTLVAFSGKIEVDGETMTESSMNTHSAGEYIGEAQTAEAFQRAEFGLLIVANKFQTGFDQPLLHTMYVDKKLWGVSAVQTLSRLNRIHAEKTDTMVIDFVNTAEEIQAAFEPYYERTLLSEGTDPNALYSLCDDLNDFHFYSDDEVRHFARVYFQGPNADMPRLYAMLAPIKTRFYDAPRDEQTEFRQKLRHFVRLYGFLAQILPFTETDWERLFHVGRLLLTLIPAPRETLPEEVQQQVDMETFYMQEMFAGSVTLQRGDNELRPVGTEPTATVATPEVEPLSEILAELNKLGGVEPTEDNKAAVNHLQSKLADDDILAAAVNANSGENARLAFEAIAEEQFEEMIDNFFKFYQHVTDEPLLKKRLLDWLYEQYREGQEGNVA